MQPTFLENQKVLAQKKWFFCKLNIQDIVVLKDPRNKNLIIKRITKKENKSFFVTGDNPKESTDSRKFGFVEKNLIIGKIIYQI